MEQMPQVSQTLFEVQPMATVSLPYFGTPAESWRDQLPTLTGPLCTLRELAADDAESLYTHLTTEEVSRFISPPPTSVEGFKTFIAWAHRERSAGRYLCFGVVPAGQTKAVGLFQVALTDPTMETAEWGFILGSSYWGSGIFVTGARRVLEFIFEEIGVQRLEAKAMPANARGGAALQKLGAAKERLLKGSLVRFGERLDQVLWVISSRTWWSVLRHWDHALVPPPPPPVRARAAGERPNVLPFRRSHATTVH